MNKEQQLDAKEFYFQTDLSKSQIADAVGIDRKKLHLFSLQNDWARLKRSAQHLPSIIAENCYYIIGNIQRGMLSETRITEPAKKEEINMMHKLTLTIAKLTHRSTINENMETFNLFLDMMQAQSPAIAKQLVPFIEQFIHSRAAVYMTNLQSDKFNHLGYLKTEEKDYNEERLDGQDIMEWTTVGMPVMDIEDLHAMTRPGATNHAQETNPNYTPSPRPATQPATQAPVQTEATRERTTPPAPIHRPVAEASIPYPHPQNRKQTRANQHFQRKHQTPLKQAA